jgi:hypothetical protein
MKMKHTVAAVLALSAAVICGTASAQTAYGQVGTTGFTLGYAEHLNNYVNVRADASFFNYSRDIKAGGVDYKGKLKFSNVGVYADYFPVGQFRLTGGLLIGDDKVTAHGTSSGGNDIPEGEWAAAQLKTKKVRPYLGLGWGLGKQAGKGLSFTADVGVAYGKFKTNYSVSEGLADYWGDDRVAQERHDLDSKVNDLKWYPVVRLGLSYKF